MFLDAFKRSLGDYRGAQTDVWIQLVHGGLEAERREESASSLARRTLSRLVLGR